MPFVKLDCGILSSTIWDDHDARIVFITALLMAEPREFREPVPQIHVRKLEHTGWSAEPGWYGFVPAAGVGIIKRAGGLSTEDGYDALERLGSPEQESRSQDHDGRRLIRVNGGYLILNYDKYRERDYTSAERSRRFRERKKGNDPSSQHGVAALRNGVASRDITQAEAEVEVDSEAEEESKTTPARKRSAPCPASAKLFKASPEELVESLSLDADKLAWCVKRAPTIDPYRELDSFKIAMRACGYRLSSGKGGPVRDAWAAFQTRMENAVKFSAGKPKAQRRDEPKTLPRKEL